MNTLPWYDSVIEAGIDIHAWGSERSMIPIITEFYLQDPDTIDVYLLSAVEANHESIGARLAEIVRKNHQVPTMAIPVVLDIINSLRATIRHIVEDNRDELRNAAIMYEAYLKQKQEEAYAPTL